MTRTCPYCNAAVAYYGRYSRIARYRCGTAVDEDFITRSEVCKMSGNMDASSVEPLDLRSRDTLIKQNKALEENVARLQMMVDKGRDEWQMLSHQANQKHDEWVRDYYALQSENQRLRAQRLRLARHLSDALFLARYAEETRLLQQQHTAEDAEWLADFEIAKCMHNLHHGEHR